jgi:hypothetical protein
MLVERKQTRRKEKNLPGAQTTSDVLGARWLHDVAVAAVARNVGGVWMGAEVGGIGGVESGGFREIHRLFEFIVEWESIASYGNVKGTSVDGIMYCDNIRDLVMFFEVYYSILLIMNIPLIALQNSVLCDPTLARVEEKFPSPTWQVMVTKQPAHRSGSTRTAKCEGKCDSYVHNAHRAKFLIPGGFVNK